MTTTHLCAFVPTQASVPVQQLLAPTRVSALLLSIQIRHTLVSAGIITART